MSIFYFFYFTHCKREMTKSMSTKLVRNYESAYKLNIIFIFEIEFDFFLFLILKNVRVARALYVSFGGGGGGVGGKDVFKTLLIFRQKYTY